MRTTQPNPSFNFKWMRTSALIRDFYGRFPVEIMHWALDKHMKLTNNMRQIKNIYTFVVKQIILLVTDYFILPELVPVRSAEIQK